MYRHDDAAFFDAFEAALAGDMSALTPHLSANASPPGLDVYRNTIMLGSIDALAATFATVHMMVGNDWFRAAARDFVVAHPPSEPALLAYGGAFPAWLATFPPGADAPYLPGIAMLDWLWWQSWSAGDAPLLDPAALGALPSERLAEFTLALHPTVRAIAFDTGIPSLWLAHQSPQRGEAHQIAAVAEQILFVRTGPHVQSHLVDEATFAFVNTLASGASLLAAAEQALASDAECSMPHVVTGGIALGLFTHITPASRYARHDN